MSLYHNLILDHYRNPRNQGELRDATNRSERKNPTCGDSLAMDFLVTNGRIADVRFRGTGCVISQAAASLLTDAVKGKPLAAVIRFTKDDLLALLGVPLSPTRLKCALLSLETLHRALLPEARKK